MPRPQASSQPQVNRYVLSGQTYTVDPQTKLGAGAEGMVIAHPSDPTLCIKLFHPADPSDTKARQIARYRAHKVRAICNSGLILPSQFILPTTPVFSPNAEIIGFQMRRVPPDYHKLMKLLDGSFRTSNQVGLGMIAELFADIFDDLGVIHANNMVIGDVNLGCLMMQLGGSRAWVDTDSWSYQGFPCLATTELFAHPDLYPNLHAGSIPVMPKPQHDRFSFLIALTMMAIPGAHPFKMGIHSSVRGLQDRTKAGITVFDQDVKTPALLGSPEVLSDELLQELLERLKRRTDAPLDPEMLRAFAKGVIACTKCGTDYHSSRRQCPSCQQTTVVAMPALATLVIEELFRTAATLLFAQLVDDNLYLVCRIGTVVQILRVSKNGESAVLSPNLRSIRGARYQFFTNCLVVCPEPNGASPATLELYKIEGDRLQRLQDTSTGVLEGEGAVFGASPRALYRTAGNSLVRTELFGAGGVAYDTAVAEVYQRQTWFTVDRTAGTDREVIFGYNRALRDWEWFVILGNPKGSHYQYSQVESLGLHAGETVQDFAVHFSASSALLVLHTLYWGRDFIRYAVIGFDGKVHLNKTVDSSDDTFSYWQNLRGKLHQGKSVLHTTPDGIVKQQLSDGTCTTLPGTTGVVSSDGRLIRLDGRVGIVHRSGVLTLAPKTK